MTRIFTYQHLLICYKLEDVVQDEKEKKKLGAHAMKCVATGTHLMTPLLFEPEECPGAR